MRKLQRIGRLATVFRLVRTANASTRKLNLTMSALSAFKTAGEPQVGGAEASRGAHQAVSGGAADDGADTSGGSSTAIVGTGTDTSEGTDTSADAASPTRGVSFSAAGPTSDAAPAKTARLSKLREAANKAGDSVGLTAAEKSVMTHSEKMAAAEARNAPVTATVTAEASVGKTPVKRSRTRTLLQGQTDKMADTMGFHVDDSNEAIQVRNLP